MAIATLNPWQVLDHLSNDRNPSRYSTRPWQPLVDISESANQYQIQLELPGVAQEQVQVEQEQNLLKISGQKTRIEEEGVKYHYRERSNGRFSRSFRLPEDADHNAIQAKFEHGLLHISIAKKVQAQPRKIEIQTS